MNRALGGCGWCRPWWGGWVQPHGKMQRDVPASLCYCPRPLPGPAFVPLHWPRGCWQHECQLLADCNHSPPLALFPQILNGPQLMYMPMWDPNAESLVTGPSQDDHDGGPAAGVASGFDPSGGEPCYQFGNQWDP